MTIGFGKRFVGAMLLVAAAFWPAVAPAATIIGTLQSFGAGDTITLHGVRPNGSTFASQVLNGISTFTRTGGTATETLVGSGANSFFAFCVEPREDAQLNATYSFSLDPVAQAAKSSIAGGIGGAKALQIAQLFGNFAPNLAAPMTAIQASALQVALWEIVSELPTNPFDVTSGNTYFSTPGSSNTVQVMNLAQTYLTYVSSAGSSAPLAGGLQALTVNGSQDFLVQVVSTAPEPGTWLMLILGFGLVGYSQRRRPAAARPIAG
ncbi:MAG: PEPxxWA-CTERM sorting domain-containing protein [Pseudomonadota bacterium]